MLAYFPPDCTKTSSIPASFSYNHWGRLPLRKICLRNLHTRFNQHFPNESRRVPAYPPTGALCNISHPDWSAGADKVQYAQMREAREQPDFVGLPEPAAASPPQAVLRLRRRT